MSLIGGGTDFPDFYRKDKIGGSVISTAIDLHMTVILKPRRDKKIYLNYSKKEICESIEDLEHDLIREAMRYTGVIEGIEITTLSDIPSQGTGLGSGSAVLVAVLAALYEFQSSDVILDDTMSASLASIACTIEFDILKRPIGHQDAWGCALHGLKRIDFRPNGVVNRRPLHGIPEEHLCLFWTGQQRSSSSILTEQTERIDENFRLLVLLQSLVDDFEYAMEDENLRKMGDILNEAWGIKKRLSSNISNPLYDTVYEKAMNAGALGGKLLGAGGGGYFMFLAEQENHDAIGKAIGLEPVHFEFDYHGIIVKRVDI